MLISNGYITSSNQADDRIYYESAGQGAPVLFIHAGFVDNDMWDDQWEAFGAQYRVYRYDQLGFGQSDSAKAHVARWEELACVIDELDLKKPVLIACSQGATAALDYALMHPDNVAALVLVNGTPSGFQMHGEPPRYLMEMIEAAQQGDVDRVSELQIRIWVDGDQREPEDVNPAVREKAAKMNAIPVKRNTYAIADANPSNPIDPPAVTRLGDVRVPVLVVVGALDNSEILSAADEMVAQFPDARRYTIQNAAHVPNMEHPDEFNRVVLDFLKEKGL